MKTLAAILALLVVVAAWFVLGGEKPVLATHVEAVDGGVRDTPAGRDTRTAVTRPRSVAPPGSMTPRQVDSVEVIGLMMMLGSPRGR